MSADQLDQCLSGVSSGDFSVYRPRRMGFLGHWLDGEWAIKAYGIQHRTLKGDEPIVRGDHAQAAREHVSRMLPLTREEGAFYKTGFAVLHEGALANWLLFQWWTHQDVWCQLLSYSNSDDPLAFMHSTRPVRACVLDLVEQPIRGLFAVGADMASIMADSYPAGGISLGPAMTFGFIAGRHLVAADNTSREPQQPFPPARRTPNDSL